MVMNCCFCFSSGVGARVWICARNNGKVLRQGSSVMKKLCMRVACVCVCVLPTTTHSHIHATHGLCICECAYIVILEHTASTVNQSPQLFRQLFISKQCKFA